jgi:hypothetical protein
MNLTRTALVILAGAVISFVVIATAAHLALRPVSLATEMQNADRSSADREVFQHNFLRAHWLSVVVINPVTGIVIGLFVGLLQKSKLGLVAALCLLPQLLFWIFTTDWTGWSDERLLPMFAHQSLMFLPAIGIAYYVGRLRNRVPHAA